MTTPADATAAEEAFAACLAGRPVPDGASGLAAFTDAVRAGATAPGRPNAALAELLATGLLAPTQEPSRGTAGHPARSSRKRPRMLISTLVAKFAAAGAVAKTAAGTGAVVVALAGTGTTVALTTDAPAPVVETTTTTEAPTSPPAQPTGSTDPTGDLAGEPTEVSTSPEPTMPTPSTEPTPPTVSDPADDGGSEDGALDDTAGTPDADVDGTPAAPEYGNHGQRVSEAARDDVPNREQMRDVAHENRDGRRAERAAQVEEPVGEPAAAEPVTGQQGNGRGNGKNGK